MTFGPGTRIGPYVIDAALDAGAMGEVYRATDTRLGRRVAIKILPPHIADHTTRRARFVREAQAASRLSHPHICPVYDVGDHDGVPFLVMEYLEGETPGCRLQRGALPVFEAVGIRWAPKQRVRQERWRIVSVSEGSRKDRVGDCRSRMTMNPGDGTV